MDFGYKVRVKNQVKLAKLWVRSKVTVLAIVEDLTIGSSIRMKIWKALIVRSWSLFSQAQSNCYKETRFLSMSYKYFWHLRMGKSILGFG